MRKNSPIDLEEISGERYPDLETAWKLALPSLASGLAEMLHELVKTGELIIQDGKIMINPDKEAENQNAGLHPTTLDAGARLDRLGVPKRFGRRKARAKRPPTESRDRGIL